jgi:hypothetical protein
LRSPSIFDLRITFPNRRSSIFKSSNRIADLEIFDLRIADADLRIEAAETPIFDPEAAESPFSSGKI